MQHQSLGEESWMQKQPEYQQPQCLNKTHIFGTKSEIIKLYQLCHKRWRGRRLSSGWDGHRGTGTCGPSSRLEGYSEKNNNGLKQD